MWVHMSPPDTIKGWDKTTHKAEGHNASVWFVHCILFEKTREKSSVSWFT